MSKTVLFSWNKARFILDILFFLLKTAERKLLHVSYTVILINSAILFSILFSASFIGCVLFLGWEYYYSYKKRKSHVWYSYPRKDSQIEGNWTLDQFLQNEGNWSTQQVFFNIQKTQYTKHITQNEERFIYVWCAIILMNGAILFCVTFIVCILPFVDGIFYILMQSYYATSQPHHKNRMKHNGAMFSRHVFCVVHPPKNSLIALFPGEVRPTCCKNFWTTQPVQIISYQLHLRLHIRIAQSTFLVPIYHRMCNLDRVDWQFHTSNVSKVYCEGLLVP